jgi:DNA polymerase III epsilon subunit-like protein
MRDLAFIDVETTGLAPESSVVEIAVFRTSPDRMFRFFEEEVKVWKIMPPKDCHIEEQALAINGFSRELWKGSPLFDVAQLEFTELLHNAIVAGWNVKFDLGMLEGEYRRMGTEQMPWHYHALDVMTFMMPLYFQSKVTSLSLHAACDYFGVSNKGEHGAKADVLRTTHVFYHLCRLYGYETFDGEGS